MRPARHPTPGATMRTVIAQWPYPLTGMWSDVRAEMREETNPAPAALGKHGTEWLHGVPRMYSLWALAWRPSEVMCSLFRVVSGCSHSIFSRRNADPAAEGSAEVALVEEAQIVCDRTDAGFGTGELLLGHFNASRYHIVHWTGAHAGPEPS